MSKVVEGPWLVDFFCCEGGTSEGYRRAGFRVVGVDNEPQPNYPFPGRPDGTSRGVKARTLNEARDAMGMQWASWHGATQAVPPAYTEFLGLQLIDSLKANESHGNGYVSSSVPWWAES